MLNNYKLKAMKIILKNFKLITLFILTISLTSCNDDDDNNSDAQMADIEDVIDDNSELTILDEALELTGLDATLETSGPFTVFAPTNDAFAAVLESNSEWNSLSDIPTETLTNLLLNHVIVGQDLSSTDLVNAESGYVNTGATGPNDTNLSLYFSATDGVQLNGMSTVTNADNVASNGTVHVVDAVILLPTIATFATTNPALSTLVDALAYADSGEPTVPYIATVSDATAGPFTVFTPTNDAFIDVLAELEISSLEDLGTATTDTVLTMHIVSGNIQSSGLPNGTVTTLGGDITADNTAFTLTDGYDREIGIITTLVDIQATNGVVHVINKVIRPGSSDE